MGNNSILANMSVVLGANVAEFQKGMNIAKRGLKGFERAGEAMKGVGENLTKYLSLPLAGLAAVSLKTAGDIQALKMGLEAVMGSSAAANKEFERLKEVAKLPGLGLKEAAQGSVNLQAAGFSADLAARSLKAFGNALATVGKGRAELDGVNLALTQIINKPKVMAQELNQLRERLPQISGAMKAAFGTSSSEGIQKLNIDTKEFVEKIIAQFEKLPPVTGGLKNSFENFSDASSIALANFGDAINKNLNVEGLITSLSAKMVGMADSFSRLSAPLQAVIIGVGALAVAAPPLIIALGAISAALPTIAAGFVMLTSPIGIIAAALAGLAIAGTAWYMSAKTLSDGAVKGWQAQRDKVQALEKDFVPLVNRYEELSKKSNLSQLEQKELASAIEQISKVTPEAVTQFDKYGKALGISVEKAREFVKLQRAISEVKNKEAIDEQIKNLRRIDAEVSRINYVLQKGSNTRTMRDEFTTTTREVKLTTDEVNNLRNKLNELGTQRLGTQGLINELKGIKAAIVDTAADGTPVAPKENETWKEILENLRQAGLRYKVFGDALDTAKEKVSILQSGIGKLLSEGLSPQSAMVQKLAGQWRTLTASLKAYEDRSEAIAGQSYSDKSAIGDDLSSRSIGGKLEIPVSLKLLPIPEANITEVKDSLIQPWVTLQEQLNAITSTAFVDSFAALGDMIAAAISGGSMKSALDGFLMIIFDWAGNFGKALIAAGAAAAGLGELLKVGPAGAPLAIAAGVALVALAGVAKSALSKGPAFGGAGPSAPRSASPNYGNPSMGNGYGEGKVEFVISGNNLTGVLTREDYRRKRFWN